MCVLFIVQCTWIIEVLLSYDRLVQVVHMAERLSIWWSLSMEINDWGKVSSRCVSPGCFQDLFKRVRCGIWPETVKCH